MIFFHSERSKVQEMKQYGRESAGAAFRSAEPGNVLFSRGIYYCIFFNFLILGTSLVVQQLRPTAGKVGSNLVGELRSSQMPCKT